MVIIFVVLKTLLDLPTSCLRKGLRHVQGNGITFELSLRSAL